MTEQSGVERSTATEILRRLLDERGGFRVDFDREGARRTCWKIDDEQDGYCYFDEDSFGATQLTVTGATHAQAIAATLGSCSCSNNCTNSERTETCNADETDTWECVCDGMGNYGKRLTVHVMECTECGHVYEHVNGDYEYCPRCGRKRRDVEE